MRVTSQKGDKMTDVAEMLEEAVTTGQGTLTVNLAMAVAPDSLLGIGLQTGIEFALQYPEAATKFLEQARESEVSILEEFGITPTDRPKVCSRIAAALFNIVEGEK
jgi:hypothetical protein